MPHIDVKLGPGGLRRLGETKTYTRTNWAGDWSLAPFLYCVEAVWSCAPSLPVASFLWDYGRIKHDDVRLFNEIGKKSGIVRVYVKVEIPADDPDKPRKWFGFFDLIEDELHGVVDPTADIMTSGRQIIAAYGLEKLLVENELRNSYWAEAATIREAEVGFEFNTKGGRRPFGNRTTAKVARPGGGDSYLFSPETDPANVESWSSADIVEYLLEHQTPRNKAGDVKVPFVLEPGFDAIVPNWDEPTIPQADKSTYGLLNRLIDRRRLLLWHVWVDEVPDPNEAVVKIDTMVSGDVVLDMITGNPTIPANSHTRDVEFHLDQMTSGKVKSSQVRVVDQVIAQGARRISVASFNKTSDATIEAGWTAAAETAYEQGASLSAGYAGLGTAEKQIANAAARSSPKVADVFSFMTIPSSWNFEAGDGIGGAAEPVFITGDPHAAPATDAKWPNVNFAEMYVASSLPLYAGAEYHGDRIEMRTFGPEPGNTRLSPLVFFKRPDGSGKWHRAELMGEAADIEDGTVDNNSFSVSVSVPEESHGVRLRVTGAAQYAIAAPQMIRLANVDEDLGRYDWREAIFTLALWDQRHVEGRWPPDAGLPAAKDYLRRKVIKAPGSDTFQKIYVVAGTVVGIDSDGTLLRSEGGFIREPEDADEQLEAAAKIAGSYYTIEHKVGSLFSYRLPDESLLEVGNMVLEIGGTGHAEVINSPITEISVRWPMGEQERLGGAEPEFRFITWAGELDAVRLDPMPPKIRRKLHRREPGPKRRTFLVSENLHVENPVVPGTRSSRE